MVEVFTVVLQILRYFATLDVYSAEVNRSIFSSALELAALVLDWDYSHRLCESMTGRDLIHMFTHTHAHTHTHTHTHAHTVPHSTVPFL